MTPPNPESTPHGRRRPRWQRFLAWTALGSGVLVGGIALVLVLASSPRPQAAPSAEADALARAVERAVRVDAWERTGAVRFTFMGQRSYLWDRTRSLVRVRQGDEEVLLRGTWGRVWEGGRELRGKAARARTAAAYSMFLNDSFWMNPLAKLFDAGTSRALVALPGGGRGLLVTYASGGVTPGDSYLWELPPAGRGDTPVAWRMWVSVLPIRGLRATWERFVPLSTGARVATRHALGPASVTIDDLAGAATLAELEPGEDPFARLLANAP
jgi:hypothetical protein